MMLQPGQEFAHFKIVRELGAGGMGAVFLAEDLKLNREVALKIILAEYFDDAERLHRFQREARTAAQITHPNIMGIYDIGAAPDPNTGRELEYIVMERVKGIPLGEYFQSKNPDIGGVIRIASRIAAGLAAAHKLNIAHRDIKASNILIDEEGNPKILDFGLAKPVDPVQFGDSHSTDTVSQELTRAGKIVGTVSYMSPEQARGEAIDVRTDIFSFGVLLYRMATGEFPFAGQSQVSTLAKILEARHEAPRAKNENVPPELERIIDKCLQKDPNNRYQSAADLAVDLRNLRRMFDSGVTESISGEFRRTRTWKLSGWRLAIPAVAIVAVLAVIMLAADFMNLWGGDDAKDGGTTATPVQPTGKVVAVFDFENKTGDTTLDWLRTGLPEILMTDLAQSGSITVVSRERVMDHLRADYSIADAEELSEEMRREIEAAQQEIRQAIKDGSLAGAPGVKEVLDLARVSIGGMTQNVSHAEMVEAAQSLGATAVLTGAFFRIGDRIRIDARLEDAGTGKIVLAEKVVGEDPFALVDSLTDKIAVSLDIRSGMGEQSIASVTTNSPEAYKLYLDGMELFGMELYAEAIERFEAATRIDNGFALAYMRIGMANVFDGRLQQGAKYLAIAREHADNLPVRERSLLDIYSDLWLAQQFDAAFVKLRSYVENYPSDREARAFFGLANWVFNKDSVATLAQYDTVLASDPINQLVLSWLGDMMQQLGRTDSAVACYTKIKTYHPESPVGYSNLGALYWEMGELKRSKDEYKAMTGLFPSLTAPWLRLSNLAILQRQFDEAAEYIEEYRDRIGTDPYRLVAYENQLSNLANWRGKFRTSVDHAYRALDYAYETGDSQYVRNALSTLFEHYMRHEKKDSALWAVREQEKWGTGFGLLDVTMRYASVDPTTCDQTRGKFRNAVMAFKERTPAGLWPIVEQIEVIFEGYCASDTAKVIEGLVKLKEVQQPGQGDNNLRAAGMYLVLTGRYQEGRDILLNSLSGEGEVSSGFSFPYFVYLVGVAEQELGNLDEAKARFEEMLRYWGNPEIEIKQIKDARRRLAQLTS